MKTKTILLATNLVTIIALLIVLASPVSESNEITSGYAYSGYQEPQVIYVPTLRVVKETITNTEIIYVPEYRDWTSKTELNTWLAKDTTSENEYKVDVYDCEDFALDLSLAAAEDGYYIGLSVNSTDKHMINFAVIGNGVYKIEPQSDYCVKWERLD